MFKEMVGLIRRAQGFKTWYTTNFRDDNVTAADYAAKNIYYSLIATETAYL